MNKKEIEKFIESNIGNFSLNGTGWLPLIRELLFELANSGWDLTKQVGGKEKFGELRCYLKTDDEVFNRRLRGIVSRYTFQSLKTCELCGDEGKHRHINGWQKTLCLNHYKEALPTIEINNKWISSGSQKINVNSISRIEIDTDYRKVWLYERQFFTNKELILVLTHQQPNYYAFLKIIPPHLVTEEQQKHIHDIFKSLIDCEICGHKAVLGNHCLFCYKRSWKESDAKDWSKSDFVKEAQMDLFLDHYDHMKLFKADQSFEKNPNHQILFTSEELSKYEKELEEDEDD